MADDRKQYLVPAFYTAERSEPYTGDKAFFVRGTNYQSSGPRTENCFHFRMGGLEFYMEDKAAHELMHHLRLHFGLPSVEFKKVEG